MNSLRWVPLCIFCFLFMLLLQGFFSCPYAQERTFKNSLGMEFVLLPSGSFMMGSPPSEDYRDEAETPHEVTLSEPFYMQSTEVTVEQWRTLMGKRMFERRSGPPSQPVTKVSWFDAMEFIEKLNAMGEGTYRLPTEAEWEYACRAGSRLPYQWGEEIRCSQAVFGLKDGKCRSGGTASDGPAPVGSFSPNGWGLYDMHGNVWEWTQDRFGEYGPGPETDPSGPEDGTILRVRRGGGWSSEPHLLRCANRAYGHPATRYRHTGFRLVRETR